VSIFAVVEKTTNTSRAEHAHSVLRGRIVQLELRPGAAFTEAQLATELGLSKTPVREALLRLSGEGLVLGSPSGYRVAPITLQDTRDYLDLRSLLDIEAARTAAERSARGELSANIRSTLSESAQDTAYDPSDAAEVVAFLRLNTRLHVSIARAGGNLRLAEALERVLVQCQRILHLGAQLSWAPGTLIHDHADLVASILAGDADTAVGIATEAARHGRELVFEALLSSRSLLDAEVEADPSCPSPATMQERALPRKILTIPWSRTYAAATLRRRASAA
jgi:DNA-binding GntR family transcriptional regulator